MALKEWYSRAEKFMLGQQIVKIRPMTQAEAELLDWHRAGPVIELKNGSLLIISMDDEMNGPGAVAGQGPKGEEFFLPVGGL